MDSVLFVDDEKLITNSLRRGLIDEKYRMFFANSGEDALKVLERESVSVIVTDMKMPVMTGLALLKIVKEKYPNTIRIVLSGYTHLPQVLVTINQAEIFKFITKPWDLENEFKFVIREAIDYYNFKEEQRKSKEALEKKNVTFQNILRKYDDVVKEIKEEVEQVIIINNFVFDEINQCILNWDRKKRAPEAVVEHLRDYENLIIDILSVIPTTTKRFDIKKLVEELKLYLRDNKFQSQLEVGIDKKIGRSYRGKYDFTLQVLKNIITLLFKDSLDHRISMVVTGEALDEEHSKVVFIFEAEQEALKPMEDIGNLIGLMKILIEGIHGELSARQVKEQMVIMLSIEFQI